ncbi:MAG: preprotein translocase subunit SecE [Bacilli bacterium]|nr:preprotein translocase subunit SecE [Bacilli bacterium]
MAKVVKSNREVLDVDQELEKLETKSKPSKEKKKDQGKKKETKKVKKEKVKKPKKGIFKYFYEVRVEVSKVKWPGKKEMVKYSAATLLFMLFFSAFFYLIDLLFALLKAGV